MNSITKNILRILAVLFVIAESVICYIFIKAQIDGEPTAITKYTGIIICLCFSLVFCIFSKDWLVLVGLVFTAISDYMLVIKDGYYEISLITFSITQLAYTVRLYLRNKKNFFIIVRAVLITVMLTICACLKLISLLTVLVCIYFPLLISNTVESFTLAREKKYLLFAIGLVLFACCDTCVGITSFPDLGIAVSDGLFRFCAFYMWIFYLPSQVIITLTAHPVFNKEPLLSNE